MNAAMAAKQHAKAAWEAVKQLQSLNSKSRPMYEVASMTGDLIQIMKGAPGLQGAQGTPGTDGARGKPGLPGPPAKLEEESQNSSNSSSSNETNATAAAPAPAPAAAAAKKPKGVSFTTYMAVFGANVAMLLVLYKSIDAIIVTRDLSARAWNKKKKLRAKE
ncbi:unnamed protein product [Effrenium voratum]|uniref:Uncharacterized protein n=1 Tax=Effrenium voratum TaxID=2562239 RepID=A0AA36JF19_9DINO|nr:unnamed protein product [Effrenium voratum]